MPHLHQRLATKLLQRPPKHPFLRHDAGPEVEQLHRQWHKHLDAIDHTAAGITLQSIGTASRSEAQPRWVAFISTVVPDRTQLALQRRLPD